MSLFRLMPVVAAMTALVTSITAQAGTDRCASGKPRTAASSAAATSSGNSVRADAKLSLDLDIKLPGPLYVAALATNASGVQTLLCAREDSPQRATVIGTPAPFSGSDIRLVGIDYRVQDGQLYGVGNAGGVYRINTATAQLTLVNTLTVSLSGTQFGVDFNPAADRLRIVSDTAQNLRHNLNPGGITLNDGALNTGVPPAAGVPAPLVPGVLAAAYTNNDDSVAVPAAADTGTTMFVVNGVTDQVMLQSPPNAGVVVATGKLGIDTTGPVGFDIYSEPRQGVTRQNRALVSATVAGATDGRVGLYGVDLLTGKASLAGRFAAGVAVMDIAIPLNQD